VSDGFRFALADVIWRSRFLQFLRDRIDNLRASGIRQFAQFCERILQVPFRDAFLFEANQERAFLSFFCGRVSIIRVRERAARPHQNPFRGFVVTEKR